MKRDMAVGSTSAGAFKTFPEFSRLTLGDKAKYENFILKYPQYSEISFPTLMFWWNSLDSCAVAELNGSLVISYWMPGMDSFSGLALVGTKDVEQSICTIFDWQREQGEQARLSHVPEFVVSQIQHPDMFICKAEPEFDEYIYKVSSLYPLKNMDEYRQKRVKTFVQRAGRESVVVKPLDLSDPENLQLLLHKIDAWRKTGYLNDSVAVEVDAINIALRQHDLLGMRNICLFVDKELYGFVIYYVTKDNRYAIVTNARIHTELPWTLDYMLHVFARKMSDDGIEFINMECDLGSPVMRTLKLSFGPTDYFRKYTIEPAGPRLP